MAPFVVAVGKFGILQHRGITGIMGAQDRKGHVVSARCIL